MSVNVTVHGNRVHTRKGKILLTDIEVLKKNEIQRRRALRLLQVRQQCKDIASQIRERCKDEKSKRLHLYELELKEEFRENEVMRLAILREQYQRCLGVVGQSHRDAAAQPDPETVLMIEHDRLKKEAAKRGKAAIKIYKAQAAEAGQKLEDAEKQRNFVRTVENIRSSVVASLPKKVSWSPEGRKNKDAKHKKAPLRDVNKIPVPVAPSPGIFTLIPTHPDEPSLQGITSQGSSSTSLSSVSQRPPCIDRFVNKLASRLGTRGSSAESLSTFLSQSAKSRTRSLSTRSSDAQASKFAGGDYFNAPEQEKLLESIEEKGRTSKNATFSSPSIESIAEDFGDADIRTASGLSRMSAQKGSSEEESSAPGHKRLYTGETLLVESSRQVDDALERSSGRRHVGQHRSRKVALKRVDADTAFKATSQLVTTDIENLDKRSQSITSSDERLLSDSSQIFSRLPTVWNDTVSSRNWPSRPHPLDVIEEEGVDGESKFEVEEMGEPVQRNVTGDTSKEQFGKVTDYGSNEVQTPSYKEQIVKSSDYDSDEGQTLSTSCQTGSHLVQLYDHTHRFKHDYDASSNISVTRVVRDGENDARAEAAAIESASAATASAVVATAEAAAETSTVYPPPAPFGERGRDALRRQRLERQYQNLLSVLGPLSREERISRTVAGFGDPIEAHISDARLKERQAERQNVIASAFQNVVGGNLEILSSCKATLSPPLNLQIKSSSNANIAEFVPVVGQGSGVQVMAKHWEPDSPAAALNVGMWTSLPVSSGEPTPLVSLVTSPKLSTPSSAESSIILVPPPPAIPSMLLSPVREAIQSLEAEESKTEGSGEAVPCAGVKGTTEPSVNDLEALEGLLKRVREQRQQLITGSASEAAHLPPLPPSPPPLTAPGAAGSASADVSNSNSSSNVEIQSQSPPPPPLPPMPTPSGHRRSHRSHHTHRTHRTHHSHHRPHKHDESQRKEASAEVEQQQQQHAVRAEPQAQPQVLKSQPPPQQRESPPRPEGGRKASARGEDRRGDSKRRDRGGQGFFEGRDRTRTRNRTRDHDHRDGRSGRSHSAASLSPSLPTHELSVDVSVKSESAVCSCCRPRDADAMRLRVSVAGDGDPAAAGGDSRRRRHHRRHDARGPFGRRPCPHKRSPPLTSSGDSQPPGAPSPRRPPRKPLSQSPISSTHTSSRSTSKTSTRSSPTSPARSPTHLARSPRASSPRRPPSRSPARTTRTPTQTVRSPTRMARSPARTDRSPTRTARSPTHTERSPTRTNRSLTRTARSPIRKVRSPIRKVRSPMRMAGSPVRKVRSPMRTARSPTPARSPISAVRSAPGQRRSKSPKRSPSPLTGRRKVSPHKARSPARTGSARRGPPTSRSAASERRPPCWYERLGRTPPWPTDDSASTLYHSPPDQLEAPGCAHLQDLVGVLRCRPMPFVVCVDDEVQQESDMPAGPLQLDPLLERYVTRLLAMSQDNVQALDASSSDVSLRSDVVIHPYNTCCTAGGMAMRDLETPAPAPTPTSITSVCLCSPGRRSVGVAVSPEQLRQHCEQCARQPPDPCVAPRSKAPPASMRLSERSCSPVCPPECAVPPAKQPQRKSRSPARVPKCAEEALKRTMHRSCSPVCHSSCAAPGPKQPEEKTYCPSCGALMTKHPTTPCVPVGSPRTASSPESRAPLDSTEYLPHKLFTCGTLRSAAASAPSADPAVPHHSPAYRSMAIPAPAPPLRVGGGAKDAESSPSAPSDAAPAARAVEPWREAAADVAEMSERCARRIESLARLIEHVRQEKNNLTALETSTCVSTCVDPCAAPAQVRSAAPHHVTKAKPTHTPVRAFSARSPAARSPPPSRSPPPARSAPPAQTRRVNWSPEPPAASKPTEAAVGGSETWYRRLHGQKSAPPLDRRQPRSLTPPRSPQRSPAKAPSSPPRFPLYPSYSPQRSPRRPATAPQCPPVPPTSPPRRPASSPCESPPLVCIPSTCPDTVPLLPRLPCSPPVSPSRTCPADSQEPAEPVYAIGDGAEPLWVFTPGGWPPCISSCERSARVLRPKPPPAMWRPGVPYVEQHELSAIPEADMSQTVLATGTEMPPVRAVSHSLLMGAVSGESSKYHTGPRENLHGLLIATHMAAQEVEPWSPSNEPCATCVRSRSPCIMSPVRRSPSPRTRSPCNTPRCTSPRAATRRPCSPGPRSPASCPLPGEGTGTKAPCTCSPRRSPCTSPTLVVTPLRRVDEDDPDIVAELIRRGVLRSPFSWMKNTGTDPQVELDIDVSIMSGASSDFASDLLISGSSSTPRRAAPSSPESQRERQYYRKRGGADEQLATPEAAAPGPASQQRVADDLLDPSAEDSGTMGESLPEDLEGMFERLGLGWAASMLRKTQEAMAISSSSSETSRGASRPSVACGTGPGGGSEMNVNAVAGPSSVLRRGHSTPVDASTTSDGSGSVSWTRGQIVFTGDSDVSSVPGFSSRDLSTPSVSLVVKSKSKNDNRS